MPLLNTGTKSILFGAHCFFIHPFEVAIAWTKLYGFPWDIRLWVAFFVHDLGYWGLEKMDDEKGERHPLWGAKLMGWLFDYWNNTGRFTTVDGVKSLDYWFVFTLYHSRFFARRNGECISPLCVADKLAPFVIPKWFYLLRVKLSGELDEYIDQPHGIYIGGKYDKKTTIDLWYNEFRRYMLKWIEVNRTPGYPYFHYERLPHKDKESKQS